MSPAAVKLGSQIHDVLESSAYDSATDRPERPGQRRTSGSASEHADSL